MFLKENSLFWTNAMRGMGSRSLFRSGLIPDIRRAVSGLLGAFRTVLRQKSDLPACCPVEEDVDQGVKTVK